MSNYKTNDKPIILRYNSDEKSESLRMTFRASDGMFVLFISQLTDETKWRHNIYYN